MAGKGKPSYVPPASATVMRGVAFSGGAMATKALPVSDPTLAVTVPVPAVAVAVRRPD